MFNNDLYTYLNSLYSIPIYAIQAPQTISTDYGTFQKISSNPECSHDGETYNVERWQFSFVSSSKVTADSYLTTLQNNFSGKSISLTSSTIMSSFKEGAAETYNYETKKYMVHEDYMITWKED